VVQAVVQAKLLQGVLQVQQDKVLLGVVLLLAPQQLQAVAVAQPQLV
jgi:hypothetical protein